MRFEVVDEALCALVLYLRVRHRWEGLFPVRIAFDGCLR